MPKNHPASFKVDTGLHEKEHILTVFPQSVEALSTQEVVHFVVVGKRSTLAVQSLG
jgi:hypothetical protein